MNRLTSRITAGKGKPGDVALLDSVARQIAGKCLCALGEFSVMAVQTGIKQFRGDFDAMIETDKAPERV
jgi:NADH-quinone oxidoreductase subunit F